MEAADYGARQAPIAALVGAARALDVCLTDAALARFQVYIDTLLLWRRRLSLTAAATASEIIKAHIADSLALCRFVVPGMRVADLGSGAGFPGVPLAIACEGARISLVEPRRRRANFLREVVRRAALENAEVIEARAEALPAAAWDLVVSRAVWSGTEFIDISARLLVPGGRAVVMKGRRTVARAAAQRGPFEWADIIDYRLPSGIQHWLVVYRKPERFT
jgi:16S rRNA (guanine527-N7)-methyltransferase